MTHISQLTLSNFRNFVDLDLRLGPGVSVFFGGNAQGKTTILEAMYLLAIARSFRAENERELVNFKAATLGEPALVSGAIEKQEERFSVYVGYQTQLKSSELNKYSSTMDTLPSGTSSLVNARNVSVRKQIRVRRKPCTGAELVGLVGAVLFSADDIELVYGAPGSRRRYLDILLSQSDSNYIKLLQRYRRVVQQRNQVLRALRDRRANVEELEFWDDQLIKEGSGLIWSRYYAVSRLATFATAHYKNLTDANQVFIMTYMPSIPCGRDLSDTEAIFRERLREVKGRELALPSTAIGPHRDDITLAVDQRDMGIFASRGEARSVALALRLSEASYLSSVKGEEPIILLDDVLSEMDLQRRTRVLEKITAYEQAVITTTDQDVVALHLGTTPDYFQVFDGSVNNIG